MRLKELLEYDNIVIQCHDNPDADAMASGLGVYCYLKDKGKQVRLIYGGKFKVQKTNLLLMIEELDIPIEYVETLEEPDMLVTVDCQYGQGNVTCFPAKEVAVIDHHQLAGELPKLNEVRSNIGACSTVVRELLLLEGIDAATEKRLATAFYYGLMTDTNNFAEIFHPLDKDLRDDAKFDKSLITRFKNANLSLKELEIAGNALLGYHYNEMYRYAIVRANPCDPNILGIISDMMLEVDSVDTCLVYSVLPFGVKISVRSCVKEVKAYELAEFITDGIGSGGGHLEKAGGFIQAGLLEKAYEKYHKEKDVAAFLDWRMIDYFDDIVIIHPKEYHVDLSEMTLYKKKKIPVGFVKAAEIFEPGTMVSVRTLEGDMDVEVQEDTYIMIGIKGEIYPNKKEKFEKSYKILEEAYNFDGEYAPVVKDVTEGHNISLIPYAKACVATGENYIYVKELDHRVKIFTEWDPDSYMLGRDGDYLAARKDDLHDIYVIEKNIFMKSYEPVNR